MNYSAVAVGPFDLAAGLDFVQDTARIGMPWISANLYDLEGNLLFKPYISIKLAGIRIAVVGITGSIVSKNNKYHVSKGIEELGKLIPELSSAHEFIIVLSNLSHSQTLELTKLIPEVKIVVGADRRKGTITPFVSNTAIVTQTGSQGKYLGVLTVFWAHAPWKTDQSQKLAQMNNHLKSTNWQLSRLQAEQDKSSERYKNKVSIIKKNKERILKEISKIEAARKAATTTAPQSTFNSDIIALNPSINEDRRISAIVRSIKDKINRYNTSHAATQKIK